MSTATLIVRGYGHTTIHLLIAGEAIAGPHSGEGHTLTTWLKMMNWPRTGCGIRWPGTPTAACGRPVESDYPAEFSLQPPGTAVTCAACSSLPLRYPMLTL